MVVKLEVVACPRCQFEYSVGYTDVLALTNNKRRNYLRYMLWQEFLFFGSLWIFVSFLLSYVNSLWRINNPHVNTNWLFTYNVLGAHNIILSVILFATRIKAKYSHREIDDITIYDRSFKQDFDFDSPAILHVYFEELRVYEDCPYYYKKIVNTEN
jgi:hypothetical protein